MTAAEVIIDCMQQTLAVGISKATVDEAKEELAKIAAQAVNRINQLGDK